MVSEEKHRRFAIMILYAAAAVAAAYLLFNYLWGIILPFLIAYAVAECFKPIIRYGDNHKRFPKKCVVILMIFIAAGSVIMLLFAAGRELAREISGIADWAGETLELIRNDDEYAATVIDKICSFFPFVDLHEKLWEIRPEIDEKLISALMSSANSIAGGIMNIAGGALTFLPDAIFTFAVTLASTYYFAVDRVRINCFFLGLFPESVRPKLKTIKETVCDTALKYIRAYGIIFFITFAQLLIAFWLMGLRYAFVIALGTSIVDILPVLGTGTVLLPWAAVELISGETPIGIALLVTYGVITVSRQVIEPKIVGKFIGLPPPATLAAMFIGFKLLGVAGLLLFPLGAMIVWQWAETRKNSARTPARRDNEAV